MTDNPTQHPPQNLSAEILTDKRALAVVVSVKVSGIV